jgi:hypothetical protein
MEGDVTDEECGEEDLDVYTHLIHIQQAAFNVF